MAFPNFTRPPGLRRLLAPRLPQNQNGFQAAHIIGSSFWLNNAPWLNGIGLNGDQDALNNAVLLPESARGNLVLGAANHIGNHFGAFDRLFYLPIEPGVNEQDFFETNLYLNTIERDRNLALQNLTPGSPEWEAKNLEYRIQVRNFLDFAKLLFLHDDVLDTLGFGDQESLVLNTADARYANQAAVLARFDELASTTFGGGTSPGIFDYDAVIANPLFLFIRDEIRGGISEELQYQDIEIDHLIVNRIPDAARIIYPGGSVAWLPEVRADILLRDQLMQFALDDAGAVVDWPKFEALISSVDVDNLGALLAPIIASAQVNDPSASLLSVVEVVAAKAVTDDAALAMLNQYFGALASFGISKVGDVPEALRRDLLTAYNQVDRALNGDIVGVPEDVEKRLAATSGGRALFLLDQWRDLVANGNDLSELPFSGGGIYSQSDTGLGEAIYLNLGAASGFAALRDMVEGALTDGLDEAVEGAFDAVPDEAVAEIEALLANIGLIENPGTLAAIAEKGVTEYIFDLAGKFFRNATFASLTYASGRTAVEAFDSTLPGGNFFQLMVGADEAALVGNANSNLLLHVGHGSAYGLDGDDVLVGFRAASGVTPEDALRLDGGAGDDFVALTFGAGGFAYGGTGDDILVGGGAEAHLYGGDGKDLFHIGANTTIHDAETTGDSIWMGLPILGGTKQWWMEGNTAYWSPFSTLMTAFPVIGSEILATAAIFVDAVTMKFASFQTYEDGGLGINIGYGLGGVAKIEDYQLDLDTGRASGGVVVFEASRTGDASSGFQEPSREKFMQFINLALKAGFGVGFTGWDPVVLDLDGDGYELTTQRNSGVHFEFDGDGFAEKTGWVRPDDGFLVLDANGNGIVDDASEFFGDETQGGFVELATHDLNLDGVIDSLDTVFNNLRVWRDLDSDGATDAGELATLSNLGITSISLAATAPAQPIDIGGNVVAFESTFTLANGTVRKAGDVVLDISHIDTRYLGDTVVSAPAAALPQLRGFGNVADLHVAMSEDAALLAQVQAFDALATSDLSVLKQAAEAILYAWANVDGVIADPIGANGFDARKLAFLEAFSGQQIAPRDPVTGAVSTAGLDELEASWTDTLESLTLRLVVQSSSVPAFADMTYREDLDLIVMGSADTLKQAYSAILTSLSNDPVTALGEWEAWGELLRAVQDGSRRFDNNIVRDDFAAAQLLAAIAESGTSFDLSALAPALGITNLRIGTSGSETLTHVSGGTIFAELGDGDVARGRGGQDVYLLESGFGDVIIDDEEAAQSGDRIRFVDLNRADVSAARVGDDLVLTVTANGDKVTVLGQFADVVPISSDMFASSNRGVEEIQFADGTVMELPDIAIAVGEGTTGDDVLEGTMHTDVFQGRAGNDLLMGGDDADLYVFDAGDGADIIRDQQTNPLLRAADMLIFGDDIAPEDLVWSRGIDPNDLVITIGNGGDSITIDGQFGYSSLGYNGQFALNSRVELFSFRHYGDVYTHKDIQQQLIAAETTSGDDVTRGFGDDDTFAASAGNDTLVGLDGNDTYFFGRGVGNDAIDEQALYIDVNVGLGGLSLEMGADTVIFAAGIDPEDVIFSRQNEAPDLVVTLDTGETLTVRNQFAGFQTGPLGAQWFDRIEWFEFANGMRISWQDVLLDVTTGSAGDDSLWGDLYQDTLTGGGGNDYLSGGGYADTYIFNAGDGHDIVDDDNQFILGDGFVSIDSTPDILRFGAGITSTDISFERIGKSLKLIIGGGAGSVTLQGQNDYYHTGVFGAISNSRIERVEFADGEVWTWQGLNARAINDQTTAGDDIIDGFALEDRFEASAGNDVMRGGDSGDTYVFGFGSGNDTIRESVENANFDDDDVIEFGGGITEQDVALSRSGNDLVVSLIGSSDTLTIKDQFLYSAWFTWNDIETFQFANGTLWSDLDVRQKLLEPTVGGDHLIGFSDNDVLNGGTGNDILEGRDGSDTYVYGAGYGNDIVRENVTNSNLSDNDRVILSGLSRGDVSFTRADNNLVMTIGATGETLTIEGQFNFSNWLAWQDIETFEFADGSTLSAQAISAEILGGTPGDDNLVGTFRTDVLDGGPGNDILSGGDGSDIYVFGIGYGTDTIYENVSNANLADDDELRFGAGIAASDLSYTRNGNNLTISINGTSDSITLIDQFSFAAWYTWKDVESFRFVDGTSLTKADIQAELLTGTEGSDYLYGFKSGDRLDGGAGDDVLEGLDGSDTYVFGFGYGHDQIIETVTDANLPDDDTIEFGPGVTWDSLTFSRLGTDLTIALPGAQDTLFIAGALGTASPTSYYTWTDIEQFKFDDGTVKTKSDLFLRLLDIVATDGDDIIYDFYGHDTISGGQGNDVLKGSRGSDTYIYNIGDGHDTVEDYVITFGSSGDRILFGPGITAADIQVIRSPGSINDIVLGLSDGTGSVTLKNQALNNNDWLIDSVQFDNGLQWSPAQIANLFVEGQTSANNDDVYGTAWNDQLAGLGGDDVLRGLSGNDVLNGGAGNDTLIGADGADIYLYDAETGNDLVQDYSVSSAGDNVLRFGVGITSTDLIFGTNAADVSDMIIRFASTSGSVTLDNQILGGSAWGVDQVEFADGTLWDSAALLINYLERQGSADDDVIGGNNNANVLTGFAGNDVIIALGGNDSITGGIGDDTLEGGAGSDAYFYDAGDGSDVLLDVGTDSADRLVFGSGINSANVLIDPDLSNADKMIIRFTNMLGQIAVQQQWTNGAGLEFIEFADGTVWDYAAIQQQFALGQERAGSQTLNGTSGADTLYGYGGNDTIYGYGGNDTLIGGTDNDYVVGSAGNDTYVFNLGDGNDRFFENEDAFGYGGNDTLRFGVGITLGDLILSKVTSDWDDLTIGFVGTSDTILMDEQDYSYQGRFYNRIENFVFQTLQQNGSITQSSLSWSQIEAHRISNAATGGADTIIGSTGSDTITGGGGNDTLYGWTGSDILIGGADNDYVVGSAGNDTYVFNLGDGNDKFFENEDAFGYGGNDTLRFGVGITLGDLILSKGTSDWDDLTIGFVGTTDTILLDEQDYSYQGRYYNRIENFVFQTLEQDGSITQSSISWSQIEARRITNAATGGADTIIGSTGSDTITGGGSNDTLYGWTGSDILIGNSGNDYVVGSVGNDTYVFNLGDGNDTFFESEDAFGYGGNDTLAFGPGIAVSDIIITRSPNNSADIIITFKNSTDTILVDGQNDVYQSRYYNRIESFSFTDGSTLTHSDIAARTIIVSGTTITGGIADDALTGTSSNNVILGKAGHDTLDGAGGSDSLTGGSGNDILTGGTGFDTAVFAGLSQNYVITTGSGFISIADSDAILNGDDGTDALIGIEQLLFGDGEIVGITSPIILDLGGDGIETLSAAESNARFDLDGDGLADDPSWIGAADAFLYLDRDGNGTMSGAEEISFIDDVPNAATDLAGLAAFDTNKDGILDDRDARFADFGVWRDSDGDGAVGANETATLATMGIRSINLVGTPVNAETEFGEVAIANIGTFTLTSGATRSFADAALTYFSAASASFAPALDLLGPDVFLAPRRDSAFRHVAFLPAVEEILEILGAASSQSIGELFNRIAAESETAPLFSEPALTVIADTEREPLLHERVIDSASIYSMTFQPFGHQIAQERLVDLLDADPVRDAPATLEMKQNADRDSDAPAFRVTDIFSPVETPGIEIFATSATPEQTATEPVAHPSADRLRLDPAQHEMWGGPAWIAALPSVPGEFAEVTMPFAHGLSSKVDLTEFLSKHVADDTAPDADITRKLAMIRQDMGSFGAVGTGESDRLRQQEPESYYLYA